jgi:hypothetical protein
VVSEFFPAKDLRRTKTGKPLLTSYGVSSGCDGRAQRHDSSEECCAACEYAQWMGCATMELLCVAAPSP